MGASACGIEPQRGSPLTLKHIQFHFVLVVVLVLVLDSTISITRTRTTRTICMRNFCRRVSHPAERRKSGPVKYFKKVGIFEARTSFGKIWRIKDPAPN
jgi:hypothetical protein